MFNEMLMFFILLFCTATLCDKRKDSSDLHKLQSDYNITNTINKSDCWMKLNAPDLFKQLKKLNNNYAGALETVQKYLEKDNFSEKMLKAMIEKEGVADRELTKVIKAHHDIKIPSGMNLGGRCMIRLPDSILFFHRMKLRNDTRFRVNVLHTDIKNMVLRAHLSLNNLRLQGAYERAIIPNDPSILYFVPSFGEIHLLLKDVQYEAECRYRAIKNGLVIEHVISQLKFQDIITSYNTTSKNKNIIKLQKENLGEFLKRLKTDLNQWLKDILNDYLLAQSFNDVPSFNLLEKYDKLKVAHLAAYTDEVIDAINARLKNFTGDIIKVPNISIISPPHNLELKLYHGELRGLDTMFRRSPVTTIYKRDDLLYLDATVSFSDLKLYYSYTTATPSHVPDHDLILFTKDISSHLTLGLLRGPEVVEIDIDYLEPLGPRSLVLDGVVHLLASSYKYMTEHHVFTIMSDTLNYGVAKLKSLPKCEPFSVPEQEKPKNEKLNLNFNENNAITYNNMPQESSEISSREENNDVGI